MIGRLKGLVDGVGDGWVLIDVNGVCYLVEGSGRMLSSLPDHGEMVTLAIETYVREDQFRLFGFLSEEERSWFKLLLGVQGVGAKVALAIQSVLSNSTKIMVDVEGGNNLLYLPLDKIMEQNKKSEDDDE